MKTVKNRKRKFALGIKIAALCSCLALASVGFASWLVVHEPEDQTADGNVNVALTSSAKLDEMVVTPVLDAAKNPVFSTFIFGRPKKADAVAIKWLVPQDMEIEDLTEVYKLTFKPKNLPVGAKAVFKLDLDAITKEIVDDETVETVVNDKLTTLISKGYVTLKITIGEDLAGNKFQNIAPVSMTFNKTNVFPVVDNPETDAVETDTLTYTVPWTVLETIQNSSGTAEIPFKVEFAWGEAFGGINPYNYYNSIDDSELTAEVKQRALNVLAEIASTVKGITLAAAKGEEQAAANAKAMQYKISIDASIDLSGIAYPDDPQA